jgi:hypothetical protein
VTAYRVEYKLEIYAPRAEQSDPVTEPDLLTPIAGAPHSEPARYSTIPLAGHQPYIVRIPGRKSRFDPVTKSTDVGQFTVQLLDRKLATSDQVRHLTATMGDVYGRNRWPGCKLRIWESIDGGTTWIPYFTGRIQETSLDGPCVIEAVVRSMLAELSIPVMVGRPSTALTFVSPSQYCPLGVAAPYGPLPATPGIPLTFTTTGALFSFNGNVAAATPAHTMTDALRAVVPTVPYVGQATLTDLASAEPLEIRLRCQFTSGTFAGTTKEYRVRGAYFYPAGGRFTVRTAGSNDVLYGVAIATLANVLDPFYAALPGNGDTANVSVIAADTPPTPATPIRIGDVHPVALLRYLCRGDFSYLNPDGTARPRVQIATASFTALEADPTFGVFRGPVEAQSKLKAWAERYLTQVFGFGFRDNALGEIEVFDARTPTTLAGIPTITDADRYDDTPLGWRHVSGITAIKTTVYLERKFSIDASVDVASLKTPNDLISSTPDPIVLRTAFRADQTEQVLEIDAIGLRWFESERLQERSRRDIMQGQRRRLADELRGLYGSGASTVNGDFRRTATVIGLAPGSTVIGQFNQLPDPATNQRGGPRLFRVVDASPLGLPIGLELLDLGPASVMVAPTVGALGAGADPSSQVTVPPTLNASGDPVAIEVAVTTTSVAALINVPAAAWQVDQLVTTSGTVTVSNLPSGRRVWVRLRSQPTGGTLVRLPSAYVSPATPFRDTTALTAPSSLTVSSVTSKSAVLTWTNGSSVEVQVAIRGILAGFGPVDPRADQYVTITLKPGSTTVTIAADLPGVDIYASVRHIDRVGGVSAWSNVPTWTPAGAPPAATAPSSIQVI